MNKDLEFIRNKFDQSGVNAPDSLGEQFALDKTAESKVLELKPKKKNYRKYSALAASVAIIALAAFSVNIFRPSSTVPTEPLKGDTASAEVKGFKSRSELLGKLDEIDRRSADVYDLEEGAGFAIASNDAVAKSAASAPGGSAGGSSHSETYKQVAGVDEADKIKTDGKYIYVINHDTQKIEIFSAKGKKSKKVAAINPNKVDELAAATPDEAKAATLKTDNEDPYASFDDLYVNDGRLVAIGAYYDDSSNTSETKAFVFDVSDVKNIKLLDRFTQSGSYSSSRMINNTLYLVSNHSVSKGNELPRCGKSATPDEIHVENCYTVENPNSTSFLVVSSFNTADSTYETQTKAILGSASDVYCNENNMYVTAEEWSETYFKGGSDDYEGAVTDYVFNSTNTSTQIVKINLTDGIKITASAKVKGYIDSQYSLDEYDGNLRVATTSENSKGKDVNNLFVLDKNLKKLGSVKNFAKGEHIEAVRYVGETAYVITYEETDPLFVIDLSNAKKPEILGEVKITGFSTMLVPIDENTVLGLGYHTEDEDWTDMEVQEGFKLALFDVTDKKNPKVLDSKIYKNCNSEVQYNAKALVYNPERNDFVIPYDYNDENWDEDDNFIGEQYSGALNFKVENGKIKEIDKYKSKMFDYTDRCVYVGNTIYLTGYDIDENLILDNVDYNS